MRFLREIKYWNNNDSTVRNLINICYRIWDDLTFNPDDVSVELCDEEHNEGELNDG